MYISRLNPLPLVKCSNKKDTIIVNLPLTPDKTPRSTTFFKFSDLKYAILTSTIFDQTYIIHDNMKVIGYVVLGEYFSFRNVY